MAKPDRDRYRPKTPPAGLRGQPAESWEDMRTDVKSHEPESRESVVDAIDRRTQETKNATIDVIDRVEQLRRECRDDNRTMNDRIDGAHGKIDTLRDLVHDVRVDVAGSIKQTEVVIRMLEDQNKARERSGLMRMTAVTAEVEVAKTRALTDIEVERNDRLAKIESARASGELKRAIVRRLSFKLIAAGTAILSAALAGGYFLGR